MRQKERVQREREALAAQEAAKAQELADAESKSSDEEGEGLPEEPQVEEIPVEIRRAEKARQVVVETTPEAFLPFKHVHFVKSAVLPKGYPDAVLPEVAVAGRSNVGKSSLMNSLFNRKSLVKVSKTPGRTQLINFFEVDHQMGVVDLPGYGFAQVPDAVKRQWQPMIERYLTKREVLVACLFLLDIRRIPSEEDLELWDWLLHFEMDTIPILTKADKLSSQQQQKQVHLIAEALDMPHQGLLVTSAKDHKGRDRLRAMMRAYGWQAWQNFAMDPVEEEE
ncbi:MAG: YihA family ribosome biogenesis GTP-binding protein [Myxococcales bacterium]|nr:YihA family ribosome biogenesis GTP-binding protein [Myxococcales bacterium]MCB9642973.1 YihA family ribosome biogenesis GTP-binding protein [Myxococcales bacterium]